MHYKVSVIVPVYRVEAYAERCVRSLMEQTLEEMEVIYVDDRGGDTSMDIVRRTVALYPHRQGHVRILEQPRNMGVAAARTAAMRVMRGEYMAHCDADDTLPPQAYEQMYAAARATGADMVTCRYVCVREDQSADSQSPQGTAFTGTAMECLERGQYTYGLWDKLIRASIILDHDIYPFEGINYNEDLNVIVRALCYARTVVGLPQVLYHHLVGREGSICSADYRSNVTRHSVPCMARLDEWLDDFGRSTGRREVGSRLTRRLKFWMKSGYYTPGNYRAWRELWPECATVIWSIKSLTIKERLLMLLRAYGPEKLIR